MSKRTGVDSRHLILPKFNSFHILKCFIFDIFELIIYNQDERLQLVVTSSIYP